MKKLLLSVLAILVFSGTVYGGEAVVGTIWKQEGSIASPADDITGVEIDGLTATGDISTSGNLTVDGDLSFGMHIIFAGITTVYSEYNAVNDLSTVFGHASSAAFTINLHALSNSSIGEKISIVKDDNSFNAITIDPDGSETIGGDTTLVMGTPGDAITIMKKDALDWRVVQKAVAGTADINWIPYNAGVGTVAGTPYYAGGGYYHFDAGDMNLTQASASAGHGSANEGSGAHAAFIFGAYAAAGGSGAAFLQVSGISITDEGVVAGETETLISDLSTASLDDYYETTAKWNGVVTYILRCTGGCTQTTYAVDGNIGHSKYADFGKRDFTLRTVEVIGEADSNDSGFDICVKKHDGSGWTYHATTFSPGNGDIVCWKTDDPNVVLISGREFSWDRNISPVEFISGSTNEGLLVEVTNGTNNSVDDMMIIYGVTFQ